MRLSRFEQRLYIATAAAASGGMVNKGRAKPAGTAHRSQDFARAQVEEWRIREAARLQRARNRRSGR